MYVKKSLAILLALLLLLLTGCQKAEAPITAGPVTVTIWHDKEAEVVAVLEEAFKALEPDIHVVLEKKPSLTETLKLVGNDQKSAPDMYLFAHDKLSVYAEMGILTPVTDYIAVDALSSYVPLTVKAATYKDTLYQLPIYFETLLFMYNEKYMKESDVPKTTEELYAYMERKTQHGHFGFVEQHSTPYYASGWVHGFGGEWLSKDGTPQLYSEEVQKALAYHLKFVQLMPGETEYATVNTLFKEGKAHATIAGPWFVPTVRAAGIRVKIAPMPVVDETGLPIAPYAGVQGLHVLKTAADKKEAIQKVLAVAMEEDVMIALAKASACAPAKEGCYENETIKEDELVQAMRAAAQSAVPMPCLPEMDVMWTVAGNLLTDINMGGKDVQQSCEAAQQKALSLIQAMR